MQSVTNELRSRSRESPENSARKVKEDRGDVDEEARWFLKAALKVTLGFSVWLLRAVFRWVMQAMAVRPPRQALAVASMAAVREVHPFWTASGRATGFRPAVVSLAWLTLVQEEIVDFFARVQDFAIRNVEACRQLNGSGKAIAACGRKRPDPRIRAPAPGGADALPPRRPSRDGELAMKKGAARPLVSICAIHPAGKEASWGPGLRPRAPAAWKRAPEGPRERMRRERKGAPRGCPPRRPRARPR